ncbi:MAG: cytochrome P450, partial [Pseudodonghicola sp.]
TPDPGRFDPQRGDRRSFGFGLGMHYCLGSEIAMLEAQIALRQIARRRPRRDPGHAFRWRDRQTLRRPLRLPLILSPNESLRP